MVTTICYGQRKEWKSRHDAFEFFWSGMVSCLGSSEGERYARICTELQMGKDIATDGDTLHGERN